MFQFIDADGQGATLLHGSDCVLAEVPEDLLHSVSIGKNVGFLGRIAPLDFDASGLRRHAMFEQDQSVFQKGDQIHICELVLFVARVRQKISDNAVEPLRFTSNNLQQAAVIVAEVRHFRKQTSRTGD